jgi:hypothetical protein
MKSSFIKNKKINKNKKKLYPSLLNFKKLTFNFFFLPIITWLNWLAFNLVLKWVKKCRKFVTYITFKKKIKIKGWSNHQLFMKELFNHLP